MRHSGLRLSHEREEKFWGNVTASIDWCEGNYEVSPYFAEFWNSVSSLAISFMGLLGVFQCLKYRLEIRFLVQNLLIILVGLGSAAYHGTLLYTLQMWDELPMVYAMPVSYTHLTLPTKRIV
eukprot:TRINITY_DN6384_c0_g1_i6.p1 TRINITY_DN6384_c0_g1~~TRINITY_DN6384_c0_g1_i6.p1  ORF type:complete len:135 (+),score=17.20 TRINITY_DN6384_c0_g1_i6:41-406(+)